MEFEIEFPSGGYEYIIDKSNDNIDVYVRMKSGEVYSGSLFTLANIIHLKKTKEHESYFWASGMVIVDNLDLDCIKSCIADMVESGIIKYAFEKIFIK